MLYPKCPQCGGKVGPSPSEARFDDQLKRGSIGNRQIINSIPLVQVGMMLFKGAREIYKRIPDGGQKTCTSCHYTFQ